MQQQVSHTIQIDRTRKLVDVCVSGFFNPEDASWVGEEALGAVRSLGRDIGLHVTLFDLTEVAILPHATIALLKKIFGSPAALSLRARRTAFVSPLAMLRLQMLQLREVREEICVFETRQTALDWLFS